MPRGSVLGSPDSTQHRAPRLGPNPKAGRGRNAECDCPSLAWLGGGGNADRYESMLRRAVFLEIRNRDIPGFGSTGLLGREGPEETEFVILMVPENMDAVRESAGQDYQLAVVPDKAPAVLSRFDARSQLDEASAEEKGGD